jgi:RNA polymerase sigma factor (sigma-70 family)
MNQQQVDRVKTQARFLARKSGVTDYDSVQEIEGECLLAAVEVMAKFDGEEIGDGLLVQAATWAFFNGRRYRAKEPEMESLDAVLGEDEAGDQFTLHDQIATEDLGPEELLEESEMAELIRMNVDSLTSMESDIITHLFGLDGNETSTQEEIAEDMGVSQQYVSKLYMTALAKLKARMGDSV